MRKLGRVLACVLSHRSGLATVSSAAVPPCMLAMVLRSSSGQSKGTLGCASLRGARWCSPRGRRPRRRREPAGRSRPECGMADPWGHDPWVPLVSASAGVDLGRASSYSCLKVCTRGSSQPVRVPTGHRAKWVSGYQKDPIRSGACNKQTDLINKAIKQTD